MKFETERIPLPEVITLQRGFDLPEHKRRPGSVPVVASTKIVGHHDEAKVQAPGVIIGRSGSLGGAQYLTEPFWPLNTTLWVKDFKGNDPAFVYYMLKSLDFSRMNAGSGVPTLNRNHLTSTYVWVPRREEQERIASVLGTLDRKIDSNVRLAATLEDMAVALFRARFAGVAGHADLVESEVGSSPRGWSVGQLGDLLSQRVDRCKPSAETEQIPYVPIDSIASKSLCLLDSRPGAEARSSLTRFRRGDLLFGAMRPYFHKVCIAPFDGVTRTTVFVLQARPEDFAYATLLLYRPETIDYATRHSRGSTIPYAKWDDSLAAMPVVVPPLDVREDFNRQVGPLLSRLATTYFQNRALSLIRDSLLPRLVFGSLRVHRDGALA